MNLSSMFLFVFGHTDNQALHFGINPVPVHEVPEMSILSKYLVSLEDNLLIDPLMLHHHPWVISLHPGNITSPGMVKEHGNRFRVQPLGYPAQDFSYLFVSTFQVLNGHVVPGECSHPPVQNGIQVGGCHHISEGIVVCPYSERLVPEVFLKLVGYGPFKSQEL